MTVLEPLTGLTVTPLGVIFVTLPTGVAVTLLGIIFDAVPTGVAETPLGVTAVPCSGVALPVFGVLVTPLGAILLVTCWLEVTGVLVTPPLRIAGLLVWLVTPLGMTCTLVLSLGVFNISLLGVGLTSLPLSLVLLVLNELSF